MLNNTIPLFLKEIKLNLIDWILQKVDKSKKALKMISADEKKTKN